MKKSSNFNYINNGKRTIYVWPKQLQSHFFSEAIGYKKKRTCNVYSMFFQKMSS